MAEDKSEGSGTSLGVQWLRLHASNAEGMGSIPGWETNIPFTERNALPAKKNE